MHELPLPLSLQFLDFPALNRYGVGDTWARTCSAFSLLSHWWVFKVNRNPLQNGGGGRVSNHVFIEGV